MSEQGSTRAPARERILGAATRLFYQRGIARTGIDLIIEEAGIAKASLYNSFGSKDALVVTYLQLVRERWGNQVRARAIRVGHHPALLFDVLAESVDTGNFHGCPFLNALSELPDNPGVIQEVTTYRNQVREFFSEFLDPSLSRRTADDVLGKLVIVHDGAYLSCKADGSALPAQLGAALAQSILDGSVKGLNR